MICYQHLRYHNDVNGNPRRLWVVYDLVGTYAKVKEVYVEGYSNLPEHLRNKCELPSVYLGPGEYRRILKFAKSNKILKYGS